MYAFHILKAIIESVIQQIFECLASCASGTVLDSGNATVSESELRLSFMELTLYKGGKY